MCADAVRRWTVAAEGLSATEAEWYRTEAGPTCVFVLLDLFTVDARRQVMLWRYYIRLARSWVAVI